MDRNPQDDTPDARRAARRRISAAALMIAAIAGGAMLGLGSPRSFEDDLTAAERHVMASELAAERLDAVRHAGPHAAVDTMATLESAIPGYPGFTRVTAVRPITDGTTGAAVYRVVTTAVSTPGLATPVRRTTVVGPLRSAPARPRT